MLSSLTNIAEGAIDLVLHPEVRDRMILMRGRSFIYIAETAPLHGICRQVASTSLIVFSITDSM